MNLTIREGVNKDSIVLQHKIALETITLLEDREIVLDTEIKLYTMVSVVDNFIEENLIETIGQDSRNFAEIVELEIEPKFYEIVKLYDFEEDFHSILDAVYEYMNMRVYKDNSLIGVVDTLLRVLASQDWSDLQYFFNDTITKAKEKIAEATKDNSTELTGAKKILAQERLDGATDKMAALIEKFQREGQEIREEHNKKEEIKVEESNE